jgi:serine/threonine protein kinase
MMKKLLKGVHLMHLHHIIHRDLKPENILFYCSGDYQSLVIGDFGLATMTTSPKYSIFINYFEDTFSLNVAHQAM